MAKGYLIDIYNLHVWLTVCIFVDSSNLLAFNPISDSSQSMVFYVVPTTLVIHLTI